MNWQVIAALAPLGLFILVIALAIVFRDKIKQWDDQLKKHLDSFKKSKSKENTFIESSLPGISYTAREATLDGSIVSEHTFSVFGYDLDVSVNTITYLRRLAKGEFDKKDKKDRKLQNPISQ